MHLKTLLEACEDTTPEMKKKRREARLDEVHQFKSPIYRWRWRRRRQFAVDEKQKQHNVELVRVNVIFSEVMRMDEELEKEK